MNQDIEKQVLQTAADVFGVPSNQLSLKSSPETIEGWDSVQHLNLVLATEQVAGISIDPEDIETIKCLGDLVNIIRRNSP